MLARGENTKNLGKSRVAFIPKPGKTKKVSQNPTDLSACHPSLLKGLERLVNGYLDRTTFKEKPLHRNIFSYRERLGTEDALHNLVRILKKLLKKVRFVLLYFLILVLLLIISVFLKF